MEVADYGLLNTSVSGDLQMKKKMLMLALATLAIVWVAQVEVRQSPPQPDCTLDPELCQGAK